MKVSKLLLLIVVIIFFHLQVKPQTENKLIKRVTKDIEVYSKSYSIVEFRSRPQAVNENVPKDELFENQQWTLKRFVLTLKKLPSGEEEKFWEYKVDLKDQQIKLFDGLNIKDVALAGKNGYVLYVAFNNLYIISLTKDDSLKWSENSAVKLATSYETQPILEANLAIDKLEITAKYYTDNQKYGLLKWKFKNNNWKLTSNKLIKEELKK